MEDRPKPDAPTVMSTPSTGRTSLGPYRLEAVLGRGGMGVVFRGVGPDGRTVAIKMLNIERAQAETVQRFARESSIRLEHANVIRTLDAGADDDGTPYIVFELLEGESLDRRLEGGTLEPEEVVDLALQMCAGLSAVHRLGIVHRDLKPANVFWCNDGVVKLLDFGIAHVAGDVQLTTEGMVIGTPQYFSPEQAQGKRDVDARGDIWALGAVCYEALCGSPPFARDSHFATMLAIVMEKVPKLRSLAPQVPRSLAEVIESCLQKEREERWESVDALSGALREVDLAPPEPGDTTTSTRMPSMRPDEQRVVAVLLARRVFDMELLERSVSERGGVLVPMLGGDAIGLFGAQRWEGDEVENAVSAALHCRHAAERMAVGSGRARSAGEGVSGEAVRAAERGCASPLIGVAVDADTARALGTRFSLRQEEGGLYEVVGERTGSLPPLPTGGSSSTVGRETQIAQMRFALESMLGERRPYVVLAEGPTGIGKTRLRQEMERLIATAGEPLRVLSGRGEPLRRDARLSLLASAIYRRARTGASQEGWPRIDPDAPVSERRQAVLFLAREAFPDARTAFDRAAFLGELLGVSMPPTDALVAARSDPQLMADRLRLAVQDYLAGLCTDSATVLLLEDLQWADETSMSVLERLVDQLGEAPLLLFATSREDLRAAHPRLFGEADTLHMKLRGLGSAQVRKLAETVAGRSIPDAMVEGLVERTEGNPLFVEQLVLALGDRGLLEGGEARDAPLPVTVEAALQSRLDHLPEAEKELCKRASLWGRPFRAEELDALGMQDVGRLLESLRRRDILTAHGGYGEMTIREYRFRSGLTEEIAYRMIAPEPRAQLHRNAGEALVGSAGASSEEIASHFERGQEPAIAARHYAQAAVTAEQQGDSRTAERCARRALELGVEPAERFRLRLLRADALRFLGRRQEQESELRQALEVAPDAASRARVLTERVAWLSREGRQGEAMRVGEAAVQAAQRSEDPLVGALAFGARAEARMFAGELSTAQADLEQAEARAKVAGSPRVAALTSERWGLLAGLAGDPGAARRSFQQAVRTYDEAGDERRQAMNEQNLADAYNRLGAYAEAEIALHSALEGTRRVGNRLAEGYVLVNLAYAQTMLRRTAEALRSLEGAEAIAEETGDARLVVFTSLYRTRALLGEERAEAALGEARQAAEGAEEVGQPGLKVMACTLAARALLALDQIDGALEHSAEALSERDRLGGIEEDEGEVFVVRAQTLEAAGRAQEAAEVRRRGADRIREVADRIQDPAWRERFVRDVAAHATLLEGC